MYKISHLIKHYHGRKRTVTAVDDVSLCFPTHGLCFLLGESGAGKTTLLQLISLQEKPTSGSIVMDGTDVWKAPRKIREKIKNEDFAILFQDLNLLSEFSVYDNLRLAKEVQGNDLSRKEAVSSLSRFGLGENFLDEMPAHLSGGQRVRVALARACVKDFRILVADEPTNSLDHVNAEVVAKLLSEVAKDHLVIATTHDAALAEKYGDRVIRISDGRVVEDNAPSVEEQTSTSEESHTNRHPKLPLRAIHKLAFHGAFHSIPRFVFSLLFSVLTLSVFMTTLSFCFYDAKIR